MNVTDVSFLHVEYVKKCNKKLKDDILIIHKVFTLLLTITCGRYVVHILDKKYKVIFTNMEKTKLYLPLIAVIAIVFIITIIIGSNSNQIFKYGPKIFFIVVCHNLLGIFLGFYLCKKLNYTEKIARTLAIEVGMQNSGLATALAIKAAS